MTEKTTVLILMGGRSAEHEVSLQSAKNVIEALDRSKYEPILVGITHAGGWFRYTEENYLENPDDPERISLGRSSDPIALAFLEGKGGSIVSLLDSRKVVSVDVVFPVLHGTYGEDGTVQGYCKIVDLPFVGAGVIGSSINMDKGVMKQLLTMAGIPNAPGFDLHRRDRAGVSYKNVVREFGSKLFVKPANLGSSVGISRATNADEFEAALDLAFTFDVRVVIEAAIDGREIECAVLGNETPEPSELGEIIPESAHGFYSYEAKYVDPDGAKLVAPAEVTATEKKLLQDLAVRGYKTLHCEGMGRVDMFLTSDGTAYINEINTIPGFTKISMYPRLWALTGVGYPELITRLIELAQERHARERELSTQYF